MWSDDSRDDHEMLAIAGHEAASGDYGLKLKQPWLSDGVITGPSKAQTDSLDRLTE